MTSLNYVTTPKFISSVISLTPKHLYADSLLQDFVFVLGVKQERNRMDSLDIHIILPTRYTISFNFN